MTTSYIYNSQTPEAWPRQPQHTHGAFSWVDLAAESMEPAIGFYAQVFGWKALAQDTQMGPPYSIFALGGQHVAGISEMHWFRRARGQRSVWLQYINVDDIHAATRRALELGAKTLVPPTDVYDVGHLAFIEDPFGAEVALWQPRRFVGATLRNRPDTHAFNSLLTDQLDDARAFYGRLFGWLFFETRDGDERILRIKNKGQDNGQLREAPDDTVSAWVPHFATSDIDGCTTRAESLGAIVTSKSGTCSELVDPHGARFRLAYQRH